MTKQGSTGQMQQKPQQLQACRTSASPGEQQQRWEWGSAVCGGWEQASASGGETVARQVLGTEGQQGRECEPGTGSLQGMQQTPDPETCPHRGTQTLPLSFVPSNVAEMLQCGARTGWKAHGEAKARVVLTEIHHSQSTSRTQQSASQHMA